MPDFSDEETWNQAFSIKKKKPTREDVLAKQKSDALNKKHIKDINDKGYGAFLGLGGSKSARSRNMKKRSYKKNQKKGGKSKRRTRHVKRRSATKKSRKHGKK